MLLERIEVYLTFNLDLYQRDKGLAYHDLGKILIGWARKLYRNELFRLNIHYQKIVIFASEDVLSSETELSMLNRSKESYRE